MLDKNLTNLMRGVTKYAIMISLPISVACVIFTKLVMGLAFLSGTIVGTLGFCLSVYMTTAALKGKKGPFIPIATSLGKALVSALIGFGFFMLDRTSVFFYIAGFVILFLGIYIYTGKAGKEMK